MRLTDLDIEAWPPAGYASRPVGPGPAPASAWPGRAAALRAWRAWALPSDGQCPPIALPTALPAHAVVWAARALARDHGVRGPNGRGGWDSRGAHGLSAAGLARCWIEARRRPGPRFAELVRFAARYHYVPRVRSLSDAHARLALRALGRAPFATTVAGETRGFPSDHAFGRRFSSRALVALGSLSPSGVYAALGPIYAARRRPEPRPVRVRDLDWPAAAAAERAESEFRATCAAAGARAPILRAARLVARGGRITPWVRSLSEQFAPQYPRVPAIAAARLALGARPVDLGIGLTAAEAHAWLLDGAPPDVVCWLASRLGVDRSVRTVAVARWLRSAMADPPRRKALELTRAATGPHGEALRIRYVERVDELADSDLPDGPRTSVARAFERAAERVTAARLAELAQQHGALAPAPAWEHRLPRCATVLRTPAQLEAEGRALGHCVGGYAGYVRSGESVILSLYVLGERSTVELRGRAVAQHRAQDNRDPSELSRRALGTTLRRIGLDR